MEIKLLLEVPDLWVREIVKKFETEIRFLDCMPYGGRGGRGVIEILGEKENLKKIVDRIKKHPDIAKVETTQSKDGGFIATVQTKRCHACRALSKSECFLMSSMATASGSLIWKILAPDDKSVTRLIEDLEKRGCRVNFLSISPVDHKEILTARQREIVKYAYEEGYYDLPKKITIEKLAKRFRVSPSTLAEILQRAEKKILGIFLTRR
jgi:predicted DNA binding protein